MWSRHVASVPIVMERCNRGEGTTGRTGWPGAVSARRRSAMVRPAAMIVLTAVEQQKLTRWERAATTP
jgi:hypothetical protein